MKRFFGIILFLLFLFTLAFAQDTEEKIAEDFINLLLEGRYEEASTFFDDSVKALVPSSKLQEIWESLNNQIGGFKGFLGVRAEDSGIYKIVYLTCEFSLMDVDIKFVFFNKKIVGLLFQQAPPRKVYNPPSYVILDSFEERDIKIGKELPLPGKLVIPKGDGPFPVVILVHGSGPNDMDESIGPNKIFRDLAWGLGSIGIASLRYDKRTKVYPEMFLESKEGYTVMEEVIEDVIYAIEFLKTIPEIDRNRIFILGHSLGGMLAPRIADLSKDVAGLIIMAGATRFLEDLIWDQLNYLVMLDGKISEEEEAQLKLVESEIMKLKDESLAQNYAPSMTILEIPVKYWADLKSHDPVEILDRLNIPALIMQGERDYQVTIKDFERWGRLSSKENITLKLYPKLNHLFMEGEGKSTPEEYYKEGHIPEYVIRDIGEWILGNK